MVKHRIERVKGVLKEYQTPLLFFVVSRCIIYITLIFARAYDFGDAQLSQWDANHYLSVAENGYQNTGDYKDEGSFIAFLPLYPMLIHYLAKLLHIPYLTTALLISNICALFATLLLYRMVTVWRDQESADTATALFVFYPQSIFLSAPYTESLFALLSLATLNLMTLKRHIQTSVMIGLALITRLTGIVLVALFGYTLLKNRAKIWTTIVSAILLLLPFSLYLFFQWQHFGTPFAFIEAQRINWYHEATWPWLGLKSLIDSVIREPVRDFDYMWIIDCLSTVVMIITLFLSRRIVPPLVLVFGWGVLLVALSQTFIVGMSRYMMLVLPFYFYWGNYLSHRPRVKELVIATLASWMTFNTMLYILSKRIF